MTALAIRAQRTLDPEKRRRIVAALLAFDAMSDPVTRYTIIKDLTFYPKIVYDPATGRHVANIVAACAQAPQGFAKLLEALGGESGSPDYETLREAIGLLARAGAPEWLPKLCNRDRQSEMLGEVLKKIDPKKGGAVDNRPLVFILDGHDSQEHESFLEAVQSYYFYRDYDLDQNAYKFLHKRFVFPGRFESVDAFSKLQWKNLARAWEIPIETQPSAFASIVHSWPGPVLVSTDVTADQLKQEGLERMKEFLRFWQKWPDAPATYPFLVCLCVRYRSPLSSPGFLARLRQLDRVEREIKGQVEKLDPSVFGESGRYRALRLERLLGVSLEAATAWVIHPRVAPYIRTAELRRRVEALYDPGGLSAIEHDDAEKLKRISMKTMVEELTALLYA